MRRSLLESDSGLHISDDCDVAKQATQQRHELLRALHHIDRPIKSTLWQFSLFRRSLTLAPFRHEECSVAKLPLVQRGDDLRHHFRVLQHDGVETAAENGLDRGYESGFDVNLAHE